MIHRPARKLRRFDVGIFSRMEGGLDTAFDKAAGAVFRGPIEPAQIAKRAEKQMNREKLVGAGKQYAPTLYTVLVNTADNRKLFGFYPTMAAEIETYLVAKGTQNGLKFDGRPLVRFIVDENLRTGKFDVIAETVAAPIIAQLRKEELEFYGIAEEGDGEREQLDAGIAGISAVSASVGPASVAAGAAAGVAAAGTGAAALGAGASGRVGASGRLGASGRANSAALAGSQARLTDINAGKSYALTDNAPVLGRDEGCDITINDANVSRRHAQLKKDATGTWKLIDLESTNGTRLNGNLVTTALLRNGDQITLGVTVLEFREN
jgi:hypothetical protein